MAYTTQYIGSRYVPIFADPAEWNSARTYEPLTIVLNEGNSYTSRQFVPVGVQLTNTDYWLETGNYNAQVEAYRQEVLLYSHAQKTYSSVANMISDSTITANMIVATASYYEGLGYGGACYLVNTAAAAETDSIRLNNGLYANLIIGNELFPEQLGAYGDGTHDDTNCFKQAVSICQNMIVNKESITGTTYNIPVIRLMSHKYGISSTIAITEPLRIIGNGTQTVLIPLNAMQYMFTVMGVSSTIGKNEESEMLNPIIEGFCIDGINRSIAIEYVFYLKSMDNLLMKNIWCKSLYGGLMHLDGVRESMFENLFTRFCGNENAYLIDMTRVLAGDITNICTFNNIHFIFPFCPTVYANNVQGIIFNNVEIHGMFRSVINELSSTYKFVHNTYNEGISFFEITDRVIQFYMNNLMIVYVPDGGAINISKNSTVCINGQIRVNLNTEESVTGVSVSSNSTLHNQLSVISVNKPFVCDSTSHIYGMNTQLTNVSQSYASPAQTWNSGTQNNYQYSMTDSYNNTIANSVCTHYYQTFKLANQSNGIHFGYGQYNSHPLLKIDEGGMFIVPKIHASTLTNEINSDPEVEGMLYISDSGYLCITYGGRERAVFNLNK